MRLYFVRHGAAEDRANSGRDFDRKLTQDGIDEVKRIAVSLGLLIGELDFIVSSPLPRALETAEIIHKSVGSAAGHVQVSEILASGSLGPDTLASLVDRLPRGRRIMVVGHEPDLSGTVRFLTGASIEMKKAGLAYVEAHAIQKGAGVLHWLAPPRLLQVTTPRE